MTVEIITDDESNCDRKQESYEMNHNTKNKDNTDGQIDEITRLGFISRATIFHTGLGECILEHKVDVLTKMQEEVEMILYNAIYVEEKRVFNNHILRFYEIDT